MPAMLPARHSSGTVSVALCSHRTAFISSLLADRSTAAAELCCAAGTLPLTNVPALSSPRTVGQHLCRILIIKLRRVPLNSRSQWPRAPTLGSMMSTSKRTKDRQEKHCS